MGSRSRRPLTAIERVLRVGVGLSVSLLAWPAEEEVRRHLAAVGQPRLLVVDADAGVPKLLDPLEDWVRLPTTQADVEARAAALLERVARPTAPQPELDRDGLLRVGAAWVSITPAQVPVLRLLLENMGRVVRTGTLAEACIAGGTSGLPASVRTLLGRLGTRIAPLGLELVTVRQRGVLLRWAEREPTAV